MKGFLTSTSPPAIWENRGFKVNARRIAVSFDGPKKTILVLPASNLLCVQEAIKQGTANSKTVFICVEREPAIFNAMVKNSRTIAAKTVHHKTELHKLTGFGPIDCAFIDLNGTITPQLAKWIATELSPRVVDGADISITVERAERNNKFMDMIHDAIAKNCKPEILRLSESHIVVNKFALTAMILLEGLFSDFSFKFETVVKYRDTQQMYLLRLCNFRKRTDPLNDRQSFVMNLVSQIYNSVLEELKHSQYKNRDKRTTRDFCFTNSLRNFTQGNRVMATDLRTPIEKAWETRRKNARRLDFRARGLKAWQTRRLNEKTSLGQRVPSADKRHDFGGFLKTILAALKQKGLTPASLVKRLSRDTSRDSVYSFLNGTSSSIDTIILDDILECLGLRLSPAIAA